MTEQQTPPTQESAQTEPAVDVRPNDAPASAELENARQEAKKNLEGWQRSMAEFQNYKKRVEREMKDSYQNASTDVIKSVLPIIDDFERAMSNLPEHLKSEAWLEGVSLIQRKFGRLLEEYHVDVLDPVGQLFDPNQHQAIGMEESTEVESGHVTSTLQRGYAVGDRVLRPAIVKVAQ